MQMKKSFNFSDSRRVASMVASYSLIVYLILTVILSRFYPGIDRTYVALKGFFLWLTLFLISYYLVDKFIFEKIRVIYKTIHSQKVGKGENPRKNIRARSISEIDLEVSQWGEERKAEIERLKELETYRREYIGNISHELKTPIFNIQGYVLTLLDGGLEDPGINREYLRKAEKNISRMITILDDLETISMFESNEIQLNKTRFDLLALSHEAVESLELKSKKRECEIHFSQNYDKPIYVVADRARIQQVIINLIDNAIKYGRKKEGRIKIGYFDMDEHILMEITDNGPGIAQQELPRIFERFYRTDKGRSREQGGTGLGLAIVKHILEAHNQSVTVRSTIEVGTTFGFTLLKG